LIELVRQSEVANEPREEYVAQPPARRALNTLFYGPPGTGKTYHTLNYALSIIEGRSLEELALEDRQVLRRRFEEYKEEGQVHFVSFHQSYTYEDFIEGIKPRSEKGKVSYVVEDGIFKIAAMEARRSLVEAILRNMPQEVIAVDYGQLYKSFLEYLRTDEFNTFITPKGRKVFLHKILKFGHISVRPDKSFSVVNISKNRLRKMYKAFHGPELPPDLDQALRNLLGNVNTSAYWSVFGELKKFEAQYLQSLANQSAEDELEEEELEVVDLEQVTEQVIQICCKHVLIIDEINRGNIASIFGELITLVDEDKREGAPEEVSVILPYSKSVFSVPPNLYIIGTMNTADRSIETMDLAMRRRFTFVEMPPRPELIASLAAAPNLSGIDLSRMLEVINQRISVLLDKDYQIGHSYFLDIQNFRALRQLFAEKILPLLQEYFFSDLAKIGLVLGNGFIQKERPVSDNIFADFDHAYANELAEKHVYKLRPVAELSEADFIRIYDPTF
ncbi:MAG: AAA family ATPase, partial [Bacteroidota bacterium]